MKRGLFFFFISWMLFSNVFCEIEESVSTIPNQDVVTVQDLEFFKDLLIDEVKRQVDLLTEENKFKTFNYIEKDKKDSSNLNNALNEVVSLKLLKILEDMNKEERESFFKKIVKGTWNHKYEIVIVVIILIIVGVVINPGDFVETLSYETSKKLVENIFRAIEGILKGGFEGSGNIIKNLWRRIESVVYQEN